MQLDGEDLIAEGEEYRLPRFQGMLTLSGDEGRHKDIPLSDGDSPLIFRLPNARDASVGRQCRRITDGHFLVIASCESPTDYHLVLEPERCLDEAFLAHHVFAARGDSSQDLGSIGTYRLGADRSARLVGTTVSDSSDDGDLFVGEPPRLLRDDGIQWARVGEEREVGWKGQNFLADVESMADVLEGRKGRFFLRTYPPGEVRLADSRAFRYWPDLREIQINASSLDECVLLLPSEAGHERVWIQLIGRNGPVIPVEQGKHARLDGASVVVERTPLADAACLLLRDPDTSEEMNVVVNIPRVWWRLAGKGEWTDKPIPIPRKEFRTTAENLELLVPSSIESLTVALDEVEDSVRSLQASYVPEFPGKKQASIGLNEFADVLDEQCEKDVALRIHFHEGSATAVEVVPDARPPLAVDSAASSRVFRGNVIRRRVFRGVVLEANIDRFVRVIWGKKRHKRVIERLLPTPRAHGTIPKRAVGIFYKTKVVLHPAPEGYGLDAPQPVKAILELCGVRDARAVVSGSRDQLSLIKATLDSLARLQTEASTHARRQPQRL